MSMDLSHLSNDVLLLNRKIKEGNESVSDLLLDVLSLINNIRLCIQDQTANKAMCSHKQAMELEWKLGWRSESLSHQKNRELTFEKALLYLKNSIKMRRADWNSTNKHVRLVNTVNGNLLFEARTPDTPKNEIWVWTPSTDDLLAEDWEEVCE